MRQADTEAATKAVKHKQEALGILTAEISECGKLHAERKAERDAAQNERKEAWRSTHELETQLKACTQERNKHEGTLNRAWGRDVNRGLEAIQKLLQQKKISSKGIYGPLIELFQVTDDKYSTACEVVAGGSLSHVVVDNEATAAKIVKELNKAKVGRVTFMPLAQLHPKAIRTSPGPAEDVVPVQSLLKYDPKFEKAFQQVFGKTLLARDLRTAQTCVLPCRGPLRDSCRFSISVRGSWALALSRRFPCV